MSPWGHNNDPGRGRPRTQDGQEDRNAPEQRLEEPTERSRLLPVNHNGGYLSPDDPAVSLINQTTSKRQNKYELQLTPELGISLQPMERASVARRVPNCTSTELYLVDIPAGLHLR